MLTQTAVLRKGEGSEKVLARGYSTAEAKAASKYGVKALNAPGQNSNAVAELTVCYILNMLRRVVKIHHELEMGNWPRWIGSELIGKTVGLVDFDALTIALREGHIAGAALDAFELEPLPAGTEIFKYNVVCTPHIGAESHEAYRNVSLCVSKDIIEVLAGREPKNWVNRP